MTEQQSKLDLDAAQARLKALSTEPGEQAQIIELGATAWAQGITPELMNVFGKIASTMRVTRLDMNKLATHGINPLPLYEDVKRQAAPKPWLDAKPGEVWEVEITLERASGKLTGFILEAAEGANLIVFPLGEQERLDDPTITSGRRIWPDKGADK